MQDNIFASPESPDWQRVSERAYTEAIPDVYNVNKYIITHANISVTSIFKA